MLSSALTTRKWLQIYGGAACFIFGIDATFKASSLVGVGFESWIRSDPYPSQKKDVLMETSPEKTMGGNLMVPQPEDWNNPWRASMVFHLMWLLIDLCLWALHWRILTGRFPRLLKDETA